MSSHTATAAPATAPTAKALVLDYLDTLVHGSFEDLRGFFAPDATWTLAGDLPLSRTWTGPGEILDEFVPAMLALMVPETMEFELLGVLGEGESALAEWRTRGTARTGLRYDQHCLAVFTVRGGRITAVREHLDTLHARTVLYA